MAIMLYVMVLEVFCTVQDYKKVVLLIVNGAYAWLALIDRSLEVRGAEEICYDTFHNLRDVVQNLELQRSLKELLMVIKMSEKD